MRPSFPSARSALALLLASCFTLAQAAAPGNARVVHGQATFNQQGNVFSITNTPNTIINWDSFNINAGDITRFIQQGSDSAVLNRIIGQDPSQIFGALQSNGHVFLINPNGILFGRGSQIDVQGLTASTLALSDNDFLAGRRSFRAGPLAGRIDQQGSVTTTQGGSVFLIASGVENSGVITAPNGQVVLAAGHTVKLADSANPSLHVVVAAPQDSAVNLGQVIAQGGQVGIYGALVAQRGVLNADSAQRGANGQIVLRASGDARLDGDSITRANGGRVSVEGERVAVVDRARIEADGGSVLVGGGFQGKNPLLKNAQHVLFGKSAAIRADRGTVVLWGDATMRARGQISARGGLVETSGKWLDVNDARVQAGTWLLDPYDIEIGPTGGATLADVDQFGDPMSVAFLNASVLEAAAPGTNVVLQATHDVRFNAPVNANLGAGSLTVDAGNNIILNSPLNTGGGALLLNANHPAYASGSGQIISAAGSSVNTGGGRVAMTAHGIALAGPLSTAGGELTVNGGQSVLFTQNVDTANGALTVTGDDITFGGSGALVHSGSGDMTFHSSGGNFDLGAGWMLNSGGMIKLQADSALLNGGIAGIVGARPNVFFNTHTAGRGIDLGGFGGGTLVLDPVRLADFDAAAFHFGYPGFSGDINVNGEYSGGRATKMVFSTNANISVAAPVILPDNQGSSMIMQITAANGGGISTVADIQSGSVIPGGRLAADTISLHADRMSLGASITGGAAQGSVELAPATVGTNIVIGEGAEDAFQTLGLRTQELALVRTERLLIGGIQGVAGNVTVTSGGLDLTGALGTDSNLHLYAGDGDVNINGPLRTSGTLFLEGRQLQTAAGATASAGGIALDARGGIGSDTQPFASATPVLMAANHNIGGSAPIHIVNTGPLALGSVHQNGTGNTGNITVASTGDLLLRATDPGDNPVSSSIRTQGTGAIKLASTGNVQTLGALSTEAGDITVEAGSTSALTIGSGSLIAAGTGNIGLSAQDIINDGRVVSAGGNVNLVAATFSGAGEYAAPNGVVTGLPTPPPSLAQCLADRGLAGCGPVLQAALDACLANPEGANCAAVLPPIPACIANPSTNGCAVLLEKFAACLKTPGGPGCKALLPSLPVCMAEPTLPGCSVVLPSLATCVADPSTAGCTAVLPSLPTCVANPSAAGCSVVLPALATCVANPATAGCTAVLPSLATCVANPSATGCSVVLPALATCVANPATAGCTAVLPSLPACVANPATAGCSVVLPSLAACVTNPATAGCVAVLPSLPACVANPATAGCTVVLPGLAACIANPATAGCSAVLPSLAICTAAPSTAGCAAVLPSLSTCTANPSLAGCQAVLPTLSTCVASPATAGCVAVLPTRAQCLASPSLQGCSVVLPIGELCQASPAAPGCPGAVADTEAGQETRVASDAAGDSADKLKEERPVTLVTAITAGDKADVRKKTYCN